MLRHVFRLASIALLLFITFFRWGQQHSYAATISPIKTVFIIMLENHNWTGPSDNPVIKGSASAPYINTVLLPQASYATQYFNPPGIHPSEPNYIWLEAGDNFGVLDDNIHHLDVTPHLTTLLDQAHISSKFYAEGISGTDCPTDNNGLYAFRHNPLMMFNDVVTNQSYCTAHVRPYTELAADLQNNSVTGYNFIIPDVCDDMHNDTGCQTSDELKNGDNWLAANVPSILNSQAYKNGGVLFIATEEGEGNDGPIMLLALSPFAKGHGYNNAIHYTHSALLRTVEEIFGVSPFLGDAANTTDLSDLFSVPLTSGSISLPTPTNPLFCLGSCLQPSPSLDLSPSNFPLPSSPNASGIPSVAPSQTINPCPPTTQQLTATSKRHRRQSDRDTDNSNSGEDNHTGLITQLLQLLKYLLGLIEKLLGGNSQISNPGSPCP